MLNQARFIVLAILFASCLGACTLGTASGCSTSVASGLTAQLVQELKSMGYSFTQLNTSSYASYIHCYSPCEPYLQQSAATALLNAAKSKNDYITLNSAYRSSAQQYLLYDWYSKKKCNIGLAAKPGQSDHEGGRAIDTSSYNYWMTPLKNNKWTWSYGSSDPYHFDYFSASDLSKQSLMAFQRLHNKHSSTKLTVDGLYGPATAEALRTAPCNGW